MKKFLSLLLVVVCALSLLTGCSSTSEANDPATIIVNGAVEQIAETDVKDATAIVMQDGKIVFAGSDEEAMEYKKDDSEVIDAEGNTIMPTMTDSHLHFSTAIQAKYEINLADIISVKEMQDIISDFVKEHDDLDVYAGAGWMVSVFKKGSPTKDVLDEVCPDKPMMLQDADGHSYWVNSKALEAAGVDKAFAAEYNRNYKKNGGRIIVDKNGEPTGHLKEAASNLISKLKPDYTVEQCKEAILEQQNWFASLGITSVFDAGILNMGDVTAENYFTALSELADEGKLTCRIRSSFWVQPYDFKDYEECEAYMLKKLDMAKELCKTEYFQITTIKMMSDQVLEQETAYMGEGMYAKGVLENEDIESNNIWAGKAEMMEKVMEFGAEHDLNVHIHQIGDAAATFALDQLEIAAEKYPELKDGRVCFAHCQFINEADRDRMAEYGVSAIVAPYWAVMDDYYWDVYLPMMSSQEALDTQYPMASLFEKGINVSFHSDYVVTQPNMGWLFYSAQTRTLPQKIYDLWYEGYEDYYIRSTDTSLSQLPEDNVDTQLIGPLKDMKEALSLDQTLQAATINGAKTIGLDKEIGTIEVGKKADVMILNMNLRTAEIEDVEQVAPVKTFFEGKIVFGE